jgi:hypothetical protein
MNGYFLTFHLEKNSGGNLGAGSKMGTDRMEFDLYDLRWDGNHLTRVGQRRAPAITLVPDLHYTDLWRIQLPDGTTSDLLNKTRARDAAKLILPEILNSPGTAAE